jgi:hypothetical protein
MQQQKNADITATPIRVSRHLQGRISRSHRRRRQPLPGTACGSGQLTDAAGRAAHARRRSCGRHCVAAAAARLDGLAGVNLAGRVEVQVIQGHSTCAECHELLQLRLDQLLICPVHMTCANGR